MRKVMYQKNFSRNAVLLWYITAFSGLFLFCFSPLTQQHSASLEDDQNRQATAAEPTEFSDHTVSGTDIAEDVSPVFLMQGDRGTEVLRLQTQLMDLGYDVGDSMGVYTLQTASAVRRFQLDCGFVGDGVCSAAVFHAAAYLSDADPTDTISEAEIRQALSAAGCLSPTSDTETADMPHTDRLRNALILFQRTHGLCGSGEADYATLCALGIVHGEALLTASGDTAASSAEAARFDLRCRLLYDALAAYVDRYPKAYDLYTLTACAAVLCARTEDGRFPGGFDTVCRAGLLPANRRGLTPDTARHRKPWEDILLLRAAEDALRAFLSGDGHDISRGALYVQPADTALPQDADVRLRTRYFVFYR